MNQRERFLKVMNFEKVKGGFTRGCTGGWPETQERWEKEGWDGRPLHEIFSTDNLIKMGVYYGPVPALEYKIIEEDEKTRLYINHEGILMREFKDNPNSSMPQFVRFPVEKEEDFDHFTKERFGLNFDKRKPDKWESNLKSWSHRNEPLMCWANRWGGYFGPLRNLMGLENLCVAFYEQPKLIEKMMEQRTESIIRITEKVLEHTTIDTFWFWEDMAYNHGSLIDPVMFRRFALPHYRKVCNWLRKNGIEIIFLDSDGDIHELIPIWLEAGINGLWPFEVQAGMDIVQVRQKYGHDLLIAGGIDKRAVAIGSETMRREVDHVMPLVEDGGYMPELDHSAPPDISWQNMCKYIEYLLRRLDRG